jgi:hypothetical protein
VQRKDTVIMMIVIGPVLVPSNRACKRLLVDQVIICTVVVTTWINESEYIRGVVTILIFMKKEEGSET